MVNEDVRGLENYEKLYGENGKFIAPILVRLFENNIKVPYIKLDSNERSGCDLFTDSLYHSTMSEQYTFCSDQIHGVTFDKLKNILKTVFDFDTFKWSTSEFRTPTFIINQTDNNNGVNYSWFGFGADNFIQALEEQKLRYADTKIKRQHHREMACFIARMDNFFFYIAMQPDANGEEITFDYMQVGFILDAFPFSVERFANFFKNVGLKEPDTISKAYKTTEIKLSTEGIKLNPVAYGKYGYDYDWTTKIIIENPFFGDEKRYKEISGYRKLVVDLINSQASNNKPNYKLLKLIVMNIPYGNFGCSAIRVLGDC